MRVTKEKAAENRGRILKAAARLFRERGISGVGVDAVTEAAGLTHGSLYSQFGSKERLAAEALSYAIARSAAKLEGAESLKEYAALYLGETHRDAPGRGCALAALCCEMPRESGAVRQRFTEGLRRMVERVCKLMGSAATRRREEEALVVVATLVGALVLSRAVDDLTLSGRILKAAATAIRLGNEAAIKR
jgi:TetR/AcrR family transcriptional regulator, transcriptional repressor for nem operon